MVGRVRGAQRLSLASGCFCCGGATVIHEMMHAIGFIHEHQRPDRDQYVRVIASGYDFLKIYNKRYFDKGYGLPYDINSVMHYYTFQGLRGLKNEPIGCVRGKPCPTKLDVKKINTIYGCSN